MYVSDMLKLLATFNRLHEQAGQPISPGNAGAVASLLRCCVDEAAGMETKVYGAADPAEASGENIIHVNFNRPAPPSDGGGAA